METTALHIPTMDYFDVNTEAFCVNSDWNRPAMTHEPSDFLDTSLTVQIQPTNLGQPPFQKAPTSPLPHISTQYVSVETSGADGPAHGNTTESRMLGTIFKPLLRQNRPLTNFTGLRSFPSERLQASQRHNPLPTVTHQERVENVPLFDGSQHPHGAGISSYSASNRSEAAPIPVKT